MKMDFLPKGFRAEKANGYCEIHGAFEDVATYLGDVLVGKPHCPVCAQIAEDKKQAEIAAECARVDAERERRKIEAILDKSAIPQRYRARTFEAFITDGHAGKENALRFAKAFADNFDENRKLGRGLIFAGFVGTGKTHLACAILQAVADKAAGVYTTAHDMGQKVADSWGVKEAGKTTTDVKKVFTSCPVLVIDEVGKPDRKQVTNEVLSEVIFARYDALLPTIFITNLEAKDLKTVFEEPELDRLRETCKCIELKWESHRSQKEVF